MIFQPLRVTATLTGSICIPEHPLALDALLAAAVALRDGLAPATSEDEVVDIDVPVQRAECERYHLASVGSYRVEARALRYVTKRAPIEQYQTIGSDKIKRVDIGAGPNKSYRIPIETLYLVDDRIDWWCMGLETDVRELVELIGWLGKKRSVGVGKVARWDVATCETWPGFPVLRDGSPLRNLPLDVKDLGDHETGYAVLTYPYWRHSEEELCALPLRLD